jgi:hypothetical protein
MNLPHIGHAASRTHAILRGMTQDDMKGQRIDFLFAFPPSPLGLRLTFRNRYVDEVQDNLLIDAKRMYFSVLAYTDSS